jgi:transposase
VPPPLPAVAAALAEQDDSTIWQVDDDLWTLLEPILRSDKVRKKPGRPRRDDRAIFDGLIWLARTGAQWSQLPRTFAPKSTVHERFTEWVETGALERAWAVLLQAYDGTVGLDWTWQAADGCIVKSPFGKKGALARRKRRGATPLTAASPAPNATCGPRPMASQARSSSPAPTATT